MTWEMIKKKLTSRKLWMALAGFVSMLMIYLGADESSAERVAAIIMAGADVLAYIIAEGFADGMDANSNFKITEKDEIDTGGNEPES